MQEDTGRGEYLDLGVEERLDARFRAKVLAELQVRNVLLHIPLALLRLLRHPLLPYKLIRDSIP